MDAEFLAGISSNGSTHWSCDEALAFNPRLEALLQLLELRVERDALRGRPDSLLIHLAGELRQQRRQFLRCSGADPMALTEAGALCRERMASH